MSRRNPPKRRTEPCPDKLPPCPGPQLQPFHHFDSPVQWIAKLGEGRDGSVFHVKIESQDYALKVFHYCNVEDDDEEMWFWDSLLGDSFCVETVSYHTTPFYAECRAYAGIKEAMDKELLKREIAVPCHGYIMLGRKEQNDMNKMCGVDFISDCLGYNHSSEPIPAIVKDLDTSQNPGIKGRAKTILQNIKILNALGIYNCDIKANNFLQGRLVDFGSSMTKPYCADVPGDNWWFTEAQFADLARFDDMMDDENIKDARALRNLEYCGKLRPVTKRQQ